MKIFWNCIVLNRWGEVITSSLAGSRNEALKHLAIEQVQVIEIRPDYKRILFSLFHSSRFSLLVMSSLFRDLHNMLETGMNVPQALLILKETAQDEGLKEILSTIEINLQQGGSLTEAFSVIKGLPWVVSVTLSAGERTGRLSQAIDLLAKYFKQSYQVQNKMRHALIYPSIVFIVLILLMLFVGLRIIPQLKSLLPDNALHNQMTQCVLGFSFIIQNYFIFFIFFIVFFIAGFFYLNRKRFFDLQVCIYRVPLIGEILKESSLTVYLFNLSVLLKSGVPLLKAINDLTLLDRSPVAKHFENTRDFMLGGSGFWQSIEQDVFFPRIVSSTLRRAEEIAQLENYCYSLGEYFQNQVNSKIDGLIQAIQPLLLVLGGVFLVILATAFLLPIYSSLTTIAGGQ